MAFGNNKKQIQGLQNSKALLYFCLWQQEKVKMLYLDFFAVWTTWIAHSITLQDMSNKHVQKKKTYNSRVDYTISSTSHVSTITCFILLRYFVFGPIIHIYVWYFGTNLKDANLF